MEFTVLKTKLCVSPLFFAVLTAFLLLDKSGTAGETVLFSLLHEVGHFLALLCAKTHPQSVEATIFGIHICLPQNLSTAKKCFVLMAGFTVNFVLSAILFLLGKAVGAYINLFIGIFTAMPLAATDGGTILKTVLYEFVQQKGEKIFGTISILFFLLFSVLFIFAAVFTENYFIFAAVIYMAICAKK